MGSAALVTFLVFDERRTMRTQIVDNLIGSSAGTGQQRIECVGKLEELIPAYRRCRAELVLVGTQRDVAAGIEATRGLLAVFPTAAIIVLGAADDQRMLHSALTAGARGFLRRDLPAGSPRPRRGTGPAWRDRRAGPHTGNRSACSTATS